MSIWERKIEFIYQELDIAQEFPGEGNYRGGIKATALDSMDCISRFFASCFGRTMGGAKQVMLS